MDEDLSLLLAYEPVWAIGTGKVASVDEAGEMHAFIRETLCGLLPEAFAQSLPILYGGSVKPDNAAELLDRDGIDGLLVGGASLEMLSFQRIIRSLPELRAKHLPEE